MYGYFAPIIEEIEFMLALLARTGASKPRLRVLHRLRQGSDCCPGEEVAQAWVIRGSEVFRLKLSTRGLLLPDYFARRRLPQSASQIESGMRADRFCTEHAFNVLRSRRPPTLIGRRSVRVYVERIRQALALAFEEAGIDLDPRSVLVSDRAVDCNEVAYLLKANVEWIHEDLLG